jgi:2-polyprenyl-3-methyl-5-hydroxy-6-metoxy-1,4-benzoquinol methylase
MSSHYYSNQRQEVLSHIIRHRPGSVVEFGCGKGILLQSVARTWSQFSHLGVDLAADESASTDNLVLRQANIFEATPTPGHTFDYVLLLDVIEHFADPDTLLTHVKQFAGPDTIFIFSIPNIRFAIALYKILFKKDFPEEAGGIFDKTHLRFYTRKKILRLLAHNGLAPIEISGINSLAEVQPTPFRRTLTRLGIMPLLSLVDQELVFQQHLISCKLSTTTPQ